MSPDSIIAKLQKSISATVSLAVETAANYGLTKEILIEHGSAPAMLLFLRDMAKRLPECESDPAFAKMKPHFENIDAMIAGEEEKLDILRSKVPKDFPDSAFTALSICLFANHTYLQDDEDLVARNGLASHGLGLFQGILLGYRRIPESELKKEFASLFARSAVFVKLARDPKQAAKREVEKLWRDWQAGRTLHKSAAAFARYALNNVTGLESVKVIEGWVTNWQKAAKGNSQPAR